MDEPRQLGRHLPACYTRILDHMLNLPVTWSILQGLLIVGASLNRQVVPLWLDKQRLFGVQWPTLRERKPLTYIKLLSTISQVGRVNLILIDLQSSVGEVAQ